MKLLRCLHNPGLSGDGCVATIGNFDGVHLGHQAVLNKVKAKAQVLGLPSVAIVFEPQPQEYFQPDLAPARLMNFRQKFEALKTVGLDAVFCLKFNQALQSLTAAAFVEEVLCGHLNLKHLVVGDDFRFGSDRLGDFDFLVNSGKQNGFDVENTDTQFDGGERVSSTRVREILGQGDFELVEILLGKPYCLTGKVMHGQALGRTLGFPTANIALKRKRCALNGVYCVKVCFPDGNRIAGVANVGKKPSAGRFEPNLEVHLLDFKGDLYGQRLSVEFERKLRDEQKFENFEALTKQISQDVKLAREHFGMS